MAATSQFLLAMAFAALALATASVELPGTEQTSSELASSRKLLQGYRPIPIDASVILLGLHDVAGGKGSNCVKMVDRAKVYKGRAINFFVTFHYADYNGDNVMDKLGYRDGLRDSGFTELNPAASDRFARGLKECMEHAVDNNMYIAIHIHLDDGLNKGTWRNSLIYDPYKKYGQMSYWEGVVRPVARAVKEANYKKRDVYFAMQAEMGATLFYFPRGYINMRQGIKDIISSNGTPRNKVKVGVNVNWEKICGCPGSLILAVNYYSDVQRDWWKVKQEINIPEVQNMFRAVDWIGVSAYAGLPSNPSINDLEISLRKVDQEMGLFGMSLKGLGKELVLSEYGLGGGISGDYKTPANNPTEVATAPYWGVDGEYESAKDPWNRGGNRQFLRNFYQLTAQYAKRGGIAYPVSAIFLWNIISYDALGVHYFSTTSQGTYRDAAVAQIVTNLNQEVRGN